LIIGYIFIRFDGKEVWYLLGNGVNPLKMNEKNDWYVELPRGTKVKLGDEISVF
jgi:hypothetical protein